MTSSSNLLQPYPKSLQPAFRVVCLLSTPTARGVTTRNFSRAEGREPLRWLSPRSLDSDTRLHVVLHAVPSADEKILVALSLTSTLSPISSAVTSKPRTGRSALPDSAEDPRSRKGNCDTLEFPQPRASVAASPIPQGEQREGNLAALFQVAVNRDFK